MLTRRQFTKTGLALPLVLPAFALRSAITAAQAVRPNRSFISGVQFGLQPFCYHDLAMTRENRGELIRRLIRNGMGMVELHSTWVEPRFTASGVTPAAARDKLREWRLTPPPAYYQSVRKELDNAGISVFTYYVNPRHSRFCLLRCFGAVKICL